MEKSKQTDGLRIALIIFCVVMALIFVVLAVVAIYVTCLYNKMEYVGKDTTISPEDAASIAEEEYEPTLPGEVLPDQDDVVQNDNIDHIGQGDHILNIMLVGQDAREGERVQRSDTMILVTFNIRTKTITLTSLMRDQYVNIPGYGNTKLNHAYQYGGMSLMNETLYNHFGIEVDGNFEVDFTGFERIIDKLGGVKIDLTKKEVDYLKEKGFKNVTVGTNILSGEPALWYARLRSIDDDYERARRQRTVLMSLFDAYKELSYSEMLSLLNDILPLVRTNMTLSQITECAVDLYPMFSGAKVETLRIPADGTFKGGFIKVSEGLKLWCQHSIDFEANREILNKIFE